ncbi:MAG: AI-2E family transporter [Bacteroidaceae bacterium]
MFEREITFDRFIRGLIVLVVVVAAGMLLNRLSTVLFPFFVAWLLAYMLYPLVCFLQYRLRLRGRIVSISVALLLVLSVLTGLVALILPPTIQEFGKLQGLLATVVHDTIGRSDVTEFMDKTLRAILNDASLAEIARQSSFVDAAQGILWWMWDVVTRTIDFAMGVFGLFVVVLYTFFILLDYENISEGWVHLIPAPKRHYATMLVQDVKSGMNAYFRGQALIASLVGILFSIGFLIIDFPFAIGLGLIIGVLNLVPYLQLIAFLPTILLALLKAADTGGNFWLILLSALAVFAVVQLIQDMYLTPRIMGHVTGLNPAIILLSLSVWGSLLGMIGLIIALPLTTLLLSYYRRLVLGELPPEKPAQHP